MVKISKNVRSIPVYTRLDPDLDNWLEQVSSVRGQSKASLIYQAVKLFQRVDAELVKAQIDLQLNGSPTP